MDEQKFFKIDLGTILAVFALLFTAYQHFVNQQQVSVNQQIEVFKNTVAQNKDSLTQVIEDVNKINSKLAAMNGALPNGQPNLAAVVQEHEQKLQLLQDTLNKLHPSLR